MVSLSDSYSDGEKHELEWQQQLHISVVPVYHTLCVHRNNLCSISPCHGSRGDQYQNFYPVPIPILRIVIWAALLPTFGTRNACPKRIAFTVIGCVLKHRYV